MIWEFVLGLCGFFFIKPALLFLLNYFDSNTPEEEEEENWD